jgi:TRAP transporter TAXI family solute receptor
MERQQYQQLAIGAGLLAALMAIMSGRLPRWLRVVLVVGLVGLASGAGLYAYRYISNPAVLTVAAGSLDGDVPRLMSAIATRMAANGSPVKLKVVDKGTAEGAAKALAAGEAELAIARADVVDLSVARAVLVMTHAVVLIVVPPGSSIESVDDLKGKVVGAVGVDVNRHVISAITEAYDLDRAKVTFKDVAPADVLKTLQSKQVQAILVVMPITEKYLSLLRNSFPPSAKGKPGLVPIEAAGAIAALNKAYDSYELPKGTIRGSPAIPDEDLTTLRIPFHLVANKNLDGDTVTSLTKAVMEARRDLLAEYPIFAQVSAPSTDKDTFIPVHRGAAAYFDGDQKTIFDKYGDQFFYGSMLLGSLMSVLAAIWKFMTRGSDEKVRRPSLQLCDLMEKVTNSRKASELAAIEGQIDGILKSELEKSATGEGDATELDAISLACHRLEYLIRVRRTALAGVT